MVLASLPPSRPGASATEVVVHAAAAPETTVGFTHWTTYHGTENRSGFSPLSGPTAEDINLYDCVSTAHLRLGPVLDDSHIYAADDLGHVLALNRTGNTTPLWSLYIGGQPVQIDLVGGSLYIATVTGGLFDLSTSNGSVNWRVVLSDGVVQGVAAASGLVILGTRGGDLQAFDASTGSERWSTHLGTEIAGAPAVEGGVIYAVTGDGDVVALGLDGSILWTQKLANSVRTAPAVSYGRVIVGDSQGTITSLFASNGTLDWNWSPQSLGFHDAVDATPAIGDGLVVAAEDSGAVYALDAINGSLRWAMPAIFSGFPVTMAPALASNALYIVENGIEAVELVNISNGAVVWSKFPGAFAFDAPAIDGGLLYVGLDNGCIVAYGPRGGPMVWPVNGHVFTENGTPIASAYVSAGRSSGFTTSNGSFSLSLVNGSYPLSAYANGFGVVTEPLVVQGPVTGITIVLRPLVVYAVSGVVFDSASGAPVLGVTVTLDGGNGFQANTTTTTGGAFTLDGPNGSATVSVNGSARYQPSELRLKIAGVAVGGLRIGVRPAGLLIGSFDALDLRLWIPVAAIGVASLGFGAWEKNRRRVAAGLPPGLLSPFGRFVTMRAILIPFQVLLLLATLYSIGTILPSVGGGGSPCHLAVNACGQCAWSLGDWACASHATLQGFGTFAFNLFTGNWGWAGLGRLREPVQQFLIWWAPDSVELAVVSLALALGIGYPMALATGWRRGSVVDPIARVVSLFGLLLPSILVALLLIFLVSSTFLSHLGDFPVGTLPSNLWLQNHGGTPTWVGVGGNTLPTGFPIVDGLLHRDGPFVLVVAAKTLVQA
ncbi:MAG: PQQ-binding-like beta-propeller repeat protein, partial [Thermoplasmata archaeon]|nr:PQQ-binding-like beta-propeller repeat protein [Thermoplasmata archaeon]